MDTVYILTLSLIVLSSCSIARAKQVCCGHAGCFNNQPPFNGFPLPQCSDRIQVNFRVYTRNNPKEGQVVTRTTIPPAYMEGKRVVFVTHGYLNWNDIFYLEDIKDAFLLANDYNVIIVGWAKGALKINYLQAASNTRLVGAEIGLVADHLVTRGRADRGSMWCIGQSLGSHVCGHAGHKYKLGKVTGLDPAGPYFEHRNWTVGINPSVADFVDIWHTNGDLNLITAFGTLKPLGHVDFYPNGGGFQPGCLIDPWIQGRRNNITKQPESADLTPFCSHLRAFYLFIESITSDCKMTAHKFCYDPSNIPASCFDCPDGPCGVMGPESAHPQKGLLYLQTASSKPFCIPQ